MMTKVQTDFSGGILPSPRDMAPQDPKAKTGLGPGTANVMADPSGLLFTPARTTSSLGEWIYDANNRNMGSVSKELHLLSDGTSIAAIKSDAGTITRGIRADASRPNVGAVVNGNLYLAGATSNGFYVELVISGNFSSLTVSSTYTVTCYKEDSGNPGTFIACGEQVTPIGIFGIQGRLLVVGRGASSGALYVRASRYGNFADWTIPTSDIISRDSFDFLFTNVQPQEAHLIGGQIFILGASGVYLLGSGYNQFEPFDAGVTCNLIHAVATRTPTGAATLRNCAPIGGGGLLINTTRGIEVLDLQSGDKILLLPNLNGDMSIMDNGVLIRTSVGVAYLVTDEFSVWKFSTGGGHIFGIGTTLYSRISSTDYEYNTTTPGAFGADATVETAPIYGDDPAPKTRLITVKVRTTTAMATATAGITGITPYPTMNATTDTDHSGTEIRYESALPGGFRAGPKVKIVVPTGFVGRILSMSIDLEIEGGR